MQLTIDKDFGYPASVRGDFIISGLLETSQRDKHEVAISKAVSIPVKFKTS